MPSQTEATIELSDVDQRACQHLMRAFDIMADKLGGVSNGTAMWALALLLGKIFATAAMDHDIMEATSQRFSDMLRAAYPIQVKAVEEVMRQHDGRPRYDA
jgi:hypothetical protein